MLREHHAPKAGVAWLVALAAFPVASSLAAAGQTKAIELNPAQLVSDEFAKDTRAAQPDEPIATRTEVQKTEAAEEAIPIEIGITYYLLSDYVWRGFNLSEPAREGRERLNHQVSVEITWDTGSFGKIGFDTFFEWFEAQKALNPFGGGQNLQEADYTVRWGYDLEPVKTEVTLGYSFYAYPNLARLLRSDDRVGNDNDDLYMEWWLKLVHNDAWMWKWLLSQNEEPVLTPSFFLAQDVGVGCGGVWLEFGISHEFAIPGIDNLTITPGYTLGVDGGVVKRYLWKDNANTLRLACQQFALDVTYDLTAVLNLPKWAGTLSVSGLLYFADALGTAERSDSVHGDIQDEFYGGMSVNWGWGG
ncbi:MAG: hypothetical protein KA354_16320 [Phycisphaerae bacterium]|nr:hypothetical protein [Phycisphaerae bacterium]